MGLASGYYTCIILIQHVYKIYAGLCVKDVSYNDLSMVYFWILLWQYIGGRNCVQTCITLFNLLGTPPCKGVIAWTELVHLHQNY